MITMITMIMMIIDFSAALNIMKIIMIIMKTMTKIVRWPVVGTLTCQISAVDLKSMNECALMNANSSEYIIIDLSSNTN